MPSYDQELRACLEEILSVSPPEPDYDALVFFAQWLAERNLGLVPIAEPASFSWPGRWLARVRATGEDHAVVMFGSPSGPLFDPAAAFDRAGVIVAGWVIAALDLELPVEQPYGADARAGSVAGLLIASDAEAPLVRVGSAVALAGQGLVGDRYATGDGTFSGVGRGYQVTLVEAEALENAGLSWEDARRNIVTCGIDLNALVGRRFFIGSVECIGRRLAEPCAHLERLTRPGILRPLVHRAGLRADIVSGGTIQPGDAVAPANSVIGFAR